MDIQALFDAIGDASMRTRSGYHLTLGGAIEKLGGMDRESIVVFDFNRNVGPESPHSYRGYYSDLSLSPSGKGVTVAAFLRDCTAANGHTFEGYKGGDYMMTESTPLWAAFYGDTGRAIIDLRVEGDTIVLVTKSIDQGAPTAEPATT